MKHIATFDNHDWFAAREYYGPLTRERLHLMASFVATRPLPTDYHSGFGFIDQEIRTLKSMHQEKPWIPKADLPLLLDFIYPVPLRLGKHSRRALRKATLHDRLQ